MKSNFGNQLGTKSLYPSVFDCFRGLRREYGEETLRAVPKLPSKNAEFAKVVVGREEYRRVDTRFHTVWGVETLSCHPLKATTSKHRSTSLYLPPF